MTNFGANIFDDDARRKQAADGAAPPAETGDKRPPRRRRSRKAAAEEPAAEPLGESAAPSAPTIEAEAMAAPAPPPAPAAAAAPPPPQPTPPQPTPPQTDDRNRARGDDVALVLVDLDALQAEARAQHVELAWNRLFAGLGVRHGSATAIGFSRRPLKTPVGFSVSSGDGVDVGIELALRALAAARDTTVVLAPASLPLRRLARRLQGAGQRVELVGVTADSATADGVPLRALGRDCLFAP